VQEAIESDRRLNERKSKLDPLIDFLRAQSKKTGNSIETPNDDPEGWKIARNVRIRLQSTVIDVSQRGQCPLMGVKRTCHEPSARRPHHSQSPTPRAVIQCGRRSAFPFAVPPTTADEAQ
jgi:hypothetical protein